MKKRMLSLVALLVSALLVLTGCAAQKSVPVTLNVVLANVYVMEEAVTALTDELTTAFPGLNTEEARMRIQAVSTGDTANDPAGAMAGMAKMSGLFAAKEIELLICDADNARRYGDNGSSFIALDELFTAEEQAELGMTPVSLSIVDGEGRDTGEMSDPCGIDLSGCELLTGSMRTDNLAAYVVAGSEHVGAAKEVIRHLLAR